jgi:NADP-dependent 3-hydroxy acid dehydrogenase YdfG
MLPRVARFTDKTVLITGASSGIGAALARAFVAEGARCVLSARRADRLKALAAELGEDRALAVPCDVTQEDQIQAMVARAVEHFGSLDVVIANAGFSVAGTLERLEVADYRRQFETNVLGVVATAKAALEPLKAARGNMVFISSVLGRAAMPKMSAYAASKHAVAGLADALRPELHAAGISVTLVCPGYVKSELQQVDNRGVFHADKKRKPNKFAADADDCARAIVHATAARQRELVYTGHAKAAVFVARNLPSLWNIVVRRMAGPGARAD